MRAPGAIVTAIAAAVVTMAVAEAGARRVRYLDPVGHSYDEPRNPRFRRDWVRYTAPRPRPADSRLVIAIGNSQCFLREERDGGLAWPARLDAHLSEGGGNVIVANWCVPAGGPSEMILLAARAAAHQPEVVIVSSGGRTPGLTQAAIFTGLAPAAHIVRGLGWTGHMKRRSPVAHGVFWGAVTVAILLFCPEVEEQFIYFQF